MSEQAVTKGDIAYLIERVEWSVDGSCPICHRTKTEGHDPAGCVVGITKAQLQKHGMDSNLPQKFPTHIDFDKVETDAMIATVKNMPPKEVLDRKYAKYRMTEKD